MKNRQWKKKIKTFGAATLITGLSISSLSVNAALTTGPFGLQGAVVSDAQLSAMRGRFVDGRRVTFFGVTMSTQWYRENEPDLNMDMQVNFDLSSQQYQPILTMYRRADLGTLSDQNAQPDELDNVSDNGALESVSGVVQSIQVAGDRNAVNNNVQWVVTDRPNDSDRGDLMIAVNVGGSESHVSDDGVITQVSADAEGIGYQVDVPDVGTVTQRISRSELSGGNILQSTQLNSDLNRVQNQIGLTVQLSPASSSIEGMRSFHQALESIRGL